MGLKPMVKMHVEFEGRHWTEWVPFEIYRDRLEELLEMGAGILWLERED